MISNSNIRLIVGLGNPGSEYVGTRHNAGADLLDLFLLKSKLIWSLEKKLQAYISVAIRNGKKIFLAKSLMYMNDSGVSIQKICNFYKINAREVLIICDDITIDLGWVKFTATAGAAGHNGIIDINNKIGDGFCRYRIGVGGKQNKQINLKDHVLSKLDNTESEIFNKNINNMLEDINLILDKDVESAMNLINRKN